MVVPGRRKLPPGEDVSYWAPCYPSGGSSDSMTLAVAHVEGFYFAAPEPDAVGVRLR